MISSMRVQLTAAETAPIFEAWARLVASCNDLLEVEIEDAVAMLDAISALNIAASSARSAIHNAWYEANKRAFPGPVAPQRKPPSRAVDLSALGLTEADDESSLEEAMTSVSKESQP